MIVKESPASERSRGSVVAPILTERLDEVGTMIGDLTSRRTPFTSCMACASPIVVRYHGGVWCGAHAMAGVGLLPALEWRLQWGNE